MVTLAIVLSNYANRTEVFLQEEIGRTIEFSSEKVRPPLFDDVRYIVGSFDISDLKGKRWKLKQVTKEGTNPTKMVLADGPNPPVTKDVPSLVSATFRNPILINSSTQLGNDDLDLLATKVCRGLPIQPPNPLLWLCRCRQ